MNVEITHEGSIAVLHLLTPPVNTLTVRSGFVDLLGEKLSEAIEDPGTSAIVVTGAGRMFCGGADIADFDEDPPLVGRLRAVIEKVEASPKLIVMAIHGMALGGGAELALAGHYRIAQAGARLGFPEVTLGLLPGAGGTQRLPRLIGGEAALQLMLSGKAISAAQALSLGLVDQIVDGGVVAAAIAMADGSPPIRRTGAMGPPGDLLSAVSASRVSGNSGASSEAASRIIECVEASASNLDEGLALEAQRFDDLMRSEVSWGLRHAFLGERAVSKIPGLPANVAPRAFERVGVVGGGLMGTGIATALLNANLAVTLIEPRAEALVKATTTINQSIRRDLEKGRIGAEAAETRLAALRTATSLDRLNEVDLVIEAVFEDLTVKKEVFSALDTFTRPDAILASNTSTLDLDAIAGFTVDPSRVVGLHFFSPANIMRLLEIVRGRHTSPDVLATALELGRRLGKVSVVSGNCDGFIGNRMFEEYLRQVWFMLEEGALPEQIDRALEDWGMAMGPCRTMDLVGQDIGWAIRKRRAVEQPERPYSTVIDRICELGRFGQKTGAGIYLYPDGRTAEPDPAITQLILSHSSDLGLRRRTIDDEEIVARCLLALVNEGARIVGDGIAYRPIDVDMTYLNGYGFPRERGGPMFQADLLGLDIVLERLRTYAGGRNGWAWAPAPLLERLVSEGTTFASLNAS